MRNSIRGRRELGKIVCEALDGVSKPTSEVPIEPSLCIASGAGLHLCLTAKLDPAHGIFTSVEAITAEVRASECYANRQLRPASTGHLAIYRASDGVKSYGRPFADVPYQRRIAHRKNKRRPNAIGNGVRLQLCRAQLTPVTKTDGTTSSQAQAAVCLKRG